MDNLEKLRIWVANINHGNRGQLIPHDAYPLIEFIRANYSNFIFKELCQAIDLSPTPTEEQKP